MAKKFSAQYTAGEIFALYERKKSDGEEGRLQNTAKLLRSMCRLEHEVTIPKQYEAITKQVRTPYLRDAWLRITGSLVAKAPVCAITPKDMKNEKYREAANIAERFDMAMIERFSKDLGRDIIAINTANHVRDGEAVMKVVHRKDAWARFPKRDETESADDYNDRVRDYKRGIDLPISWLDIDRLSILYEGGDYGDNWVMEYGEYEKPQLRGYGMVREGDRLINPENVLEGRGMPEGLQSTSGDRSVKLEFWTADEWHVIIDGSEAPGFPKRNPYSPHLPYFRAPALERESLLYSLLYLVPRLDELLTMKMNWAYLGAYPNPVLETVPNSNALPELPFGDAGPVALNSPQQALSWTPGKLMDLPLGRKLSFLTPPPVGQDLNDLIVIMKNLIDVAGVPSVMRGSAAPGDAGYLYNQMMAAAQMMYRQSVLSLQRQMERATEFSHWLIENKIRQTVYVLGWNKLNAKTGKPDIKEGNAWIGLSPESGSKDVAEIKKLGPISFKYRPTLPTDEQSRAMIAMQLTNAAVPLSSIRHALEEYLQSEDPEAIMDEMWLDKAMNTPMIQEIMIKKALEEAGLIPAEPPPPPVEMNPAIGLVDQFGQPMGGQMAAVPGAEQMVMGTPAVPGVTMPIQPATPVGPGVIGATGGRPAGNYPGQPGGPNL